MPEAMRSAFFTGDTFALERQLIAEGYQLVAGADEAGRGPLAGPVVAACVILPPDCDYRRFKDSKSLGAGCRAELASQLAELAVGIGVGIVSAAEIDQLNILRASLLAMKQAVEALPLRPDFLLVDGKFTVPLSLPQKALIKGETRSASIAAASIVAKVTRDRIMDQYHLEYPQYEFARHKGYPTAGHRRMLMELGPCPIHRQSFKPVRACSGG